VPDVNIADAAIAELEALDDSPTRDTAAELAALADPGHASGDTGTRGHGRRPPLPRSPPRC
jgi:hypothetical protein